MRKILTVSFMLSMIVSCQKEDQMTDIPFVNEAKEGTEVIICQVKSNEQTRSANNYYLDQAKQPISQMENMDLSISMPTLTINNIHTAFCVHGRNGSVVVHENNDPSVGDRKVWQVNKNGNYYRVKANQGDRKGRNILVTVGNASATDIAVGVQSNPAVSYEWSIAPSPTNSLPNRYRLWNKSNHYLQGYARNSNTVIASKTHFSYLDWEIIPLEQFDMIDVLYAEEEGDKTTATWRTIVSNVELDNSQGTTDGQLSLKMSRTLTNTSTFFETYGTSLANQTSITQQIGIPEMNGGVVNVSETSARTWNYSTTLTDTEQVTLEVNTTFPVPAGKYFKATAKSLLYKCSLTYIAKYRGKLSGRIIYLKGKWEGNIYSDTKIIIADNQGKTIKEIDTELNPK